MSPFKSSKGRSLGKLIEGFKSSTIGQGFGSGAGGAITTGGTESEHGGYRYHVFESPGNFIVGSVSQIDILAVGGGGAGGSYYGGGGGAGGVVVWEDALLTNVALLTVTVGQGGDNTSPGTNVGANGADTTVTGWSTQPQILTAKGGGGGSPGGTSPGGSGGGRGAVPGSGTGGTGIQPQQNAHLVPLSGFNQYGNPGGNYPPSATGYKPAGGGGAGAGGENGSQTSGGGYGGNGVQVPQFPGPNIPTLSPLVPRMGPNGLYYGGGGSAGPYAGPAPGAAGFGGGGRGLAPAPDDLNRGADGLGGGGGGRHPNTQTGMPTEGGDGIVIIRYSTS
tara:strand:+ start:28 stop:1029 length:1002 start_codon:yes stop_codon:yes gene_type:complete